MSSYPIIKIPDPLERAYRSAPVLANFKDNPAPPALATPQYFNLPLLAIEAALAVILSGICWSLSGWLSIGLGLGGLFLTVVHAWTMNRTYPERWYLYRTQNERYLQRQWESEFSQARSDRLQTADGIARYRRQKVAAVLKHTAAANTARETLSPAVHQFAHILAQWFPEQIEAEAGLAWIDRDSNLHIIIAIDEPYQNIDGTIQATHYAGATADHRSNNFYLDRGWVVMRFSSLQTIDYPDRCGKVIAELVAELLQDEAWLTPFLTIENLAITPQWTQAEAQQLAQLAQLQYA
jgi:hypothetical protein